MKKSPKFCQMINCQIHTNQFVQSGKMDASVSIFMLIVFPSPAQPHPLERWAAFIAICSSLYFLRSALMCAGNFSCFGASSVRLSPFISTTNGIRQPKVRHTALVNFNIGNINSARFHWHSGRFGWCSLRCY